MLLCLSVKNRGEREREECGEEERGRERNFVMVVVVFLLLLEIAGIIIAIIAVCTKRTFLPPPFVWGMGPMGTPLSTTFSHYR